ncbi:STE3-domain-containing protein, partial [Peniophora sp. CONT]
MSTLIIIRQLHTIVSLKTVESPNKRRRRAVDWILGLVLPVLIAGPLYYVNQGARFQVLEGFGCAAVQYPSILPILTTSCYTIIPPLISVLVYYPRVIAVFYHHHKEVNRFLRSNDSVSRTNYFRILALASIDVLVTLPLGAISLALFLIPATRNDGDIAVDNISFYPGWHFLHTNWAPTGSSYEEIVAAGNLRLQQLYFSYWTGPMLAFVIFGLFGLTHDARATYRRTIRAFKRLLGMTVVVPSRDPASSCPIVFHARPQICNVVLNTAQETDPEHSHGITVEGLGAEQSNDDAERIAAIGHGYSLCETSNPS